MSDIETAVDGAVVAPVAIEQEPAQTPTTEQVEAQEQTRDDKGRFVPQERVNEITRARREAERGWQSERQLREQAETRLAQFERQPAQQQQGTKPPTLADHNWDQDAFGEALTQYAVSKASEQAEQRYRDHDSRRQREQAASSFDAKARTYAAEHPGYQDRVQALDEVVRFQPELVEAISLSDHGPALADYLATHLDEADRISRLPAHLAAVQLGRLEAQVSAPKPKHVSNAPNPAPTLGGGSRSNDLRDDMTYDQYRAARER